MGLSVVEAMLTVLNYIDVSVPINVIQCYITVYQDFSLYSVDLGAMLYGVFLHLFVLWQSKVNSFLYCTCCKYPLFLQIIQ